MKKILVPCDFSKQAVNALQFALDLASESKGEVHLLNAIELPTMYDTTLMPALSFEQQLLKELENNAENHFKKLKEKHNNAGIEIQSHIKFGNPYRMIIDYATENKIDLIVMGTHGASGMREVLIGSNTEKIVRSATVPVIAIKDYIELKSIKNIVFPNTLTKDHEDLTMKVKALQNFFDATLHIVWINTLNNFTRDTITYQRLNEFAKRFMLKDFTLNVFNDPYEESGVINFAHMIKADMIAMGTHGRKGIAHFLNGSVAEDVVNHVDCPMWTYAIKPN
jgi:nucleotide-binding universal stress UspA family protein